MENEIESLEIKMIKHLSAQYAKETKAIQNRLEKFGFNESNLNENSRKYLDYLVDLAIKLKLETTDESNYLIGLVNLSNEAFKHEYSKLVVNEESIKLKESLIKLNLYQQTIKKDLKLLEENLVVEKEKFLEKESDLQLLQRKVEKYSIQLKEFQEKKTNFSTSLMHENLIQDYQKMINLQQKVEVENSRLEVYDDLPPSIAQAKAKIQEVENEISFIDKEIEKKLDII